MRPEPLDHLTVQRREDGVVVVTLNLPERRNAMSEQMTASWGELMAELAGDRSLRCLVVTGGGSAFCSGGDVSWIGAQPDATVDELRERMLPFYRTWLSILDIEAPTVAAVNGPAIGAGAVLALACDLRYAGEDAPIAFPFTALGMHPGMATTWLLPQVVGLAPARELLLTGRTVRGPEAVGLGLVNQVFPGESLLDETIAVASSIAAKAPVATRLTKVALGRGGHPTLAGALEWEALAQPVTLATQDLREGLRAQQEKRAPRFSGR